MITHREERPADGTSLPGPNAAVARKRMQKSRTAWWMAAVLAAALMSEAGSWVGQYGERPGAGVTTLELLPQSKWGFGTILERGMACGPAGGGGFVTRQSRLGFFAVSVQTRSPAARP